MKNLSMLMMALLLAASFGSYAQKSTFQTETKADIMPLNLGISSNKTTNLIFPFAIKSVDKGGPQVLVQKAKGVENVLQLKAAKDSFIETNLSVIAGDGLLYSFMLHFSDQPTVLNLELANKPMGYQPIAIFTANHDNQKKLLNASEYVSTKKASIGKPSDKASKVEVSLNGLYIREDAMYFQLMLENSSNIAYHVEQLRIFIRDKKKSKRTASQELEQQPLYIYGNATVIHDKSSQVVVVSLPKFTIPDKKELIIQLMEKNGGRNLQLKVKNKALMSATPF